MDIKPYMCTYNDCKPVDRMFGSRQEWMNHEKTLHSSPTICGPGSSTRTCPFCHANFPPEKSQERVYRHIGNHMEDIRLLALPPSLRNPEDDEDVDMLDDSSDESSTEITLPWSSMYSEVEETHERVPSGKKTEKSLANLTRPDIRPQSQSQAPQVETKQNVPAPPQLSPLSPKKLLLVFLIVEHYSGFFLGVCFCYAGAYVSWV